MRTLSAQAFVPVAVFLVALAWRLEDLGLESLWMDEAITYGRALLPLPDLIADTIARKHVPTYFVFMHGWTQLGDSEAFLRLPSAVFGAFAALFVALAACRIRGPLAGLAAGLCAAMASAQVYYGQEARMYTLLTCECAFALYCYAVLFAGRARSWSAGRSPRLCYAGLSLASVALLYTHNTGMFCVAGLGALGLSLVVDSRTQRLPVLRDYALSQGIAVLAWLPWLPNLMRQAGTFDKWRNRPLSLAHATIMAEQLFALDSVPSQVFVGLSALTLLSLLRSSERKPVYLGLLSAVLLGVAATAVASLLKANMFFLRTLLWCALPLYVLVGCGIAGLPQRFLPALTLAVVVALQTPALTELHRTPRKTPWRGFLHNLVEHTDAQTPILSVRGSRFTGYYFGRHDEPLPARPVREWEPGLSLEKNLPARTRRFGVVMWRGSGRAGSFYRQLRKSPFKPRKVWTEGAAYVAVFERE